MKKLLKNIALVGLFSIALTHISCGSSTKPTAKNTIINASKMDTITFGAGCFWCVEAVYQRLKGVQSVTSGYMGGKLNNPTYREVCSGLTGHAEVCQIVYDPKVISFETLLEVFWQTHDPTTLNRQGADVGTQYRSAIFAHSDEQLRLAEAWKINLNAKHVFPNPIVTQVEKANTFFPAEDYHQDYYNLNGAEPYCQIVIKPKMDKFLKVFKDKLN
jgi:peptide-methionine (S)-S-oxide reductase